MNGPNCDRRYVQTQGWSGQLKLSASILERLYASEVNCDYRGLSTKKRMIIPIYQLDVVSTRAKSEFAKNRSKNKIERSMKFWWFPILFCDGSSIVSHRSSGPGTHKYDSSRKSARKLYKFTMPIVWHYGIECINRRQGDCPRGKITMPVCYAERTLRFKSLT